MQIRGVEGDFLVLAYDGADRLYLPVGEAPAGPEVHRRRRPRRCGSTGWAARPSRCARRGSRSSCSRWRPSCSSIYAARTAHPGHAYPEPDEIYREFEAEFPFEETPDQQKAIDDVLRDLRKGRTARPSAPMDRLVCGDVGYGKTEVAMRAAMLAVLGAEAGGGAGADHRPGRPARAHLPRALQGLPGPHRGGLADEDRRGGASGSSRRPPQGKVDILIGTHRLLAADVSFKDLGLVVVDEEQRFGVAHKERLKKLRKLVDVLTLTATPIPRTLHMSLAGRARPLHHRHPARGPARHPHLRDRSSTRPR